MKDLVDEENYFTLNRVRQYGKTTTLVALEQYLKKDHQIIEELQSLIMQRSPYFTLQMLFEHLSDICAALDKLVVLIVDEVDSASNNQVFLDFLARSFSNFGGYR